jgi:beta-galactosidase
LAPAPAYCSQRPCPAAAPSSASPGGRPRPWSPSSAASSPSARDPSIPATPAPPPPTSPRQPPPARPRLTPRVRFSQPLLNDWSPKDQSPHTENVEVYTNAEEVELLLNGKSLGLQKLHADASPITYSVPYTPGEIKAIARTHSQIVATEVLKTAGKPAQILFTADTPGRPVTPAWDDVRYLTATLVDSAGTRIPDSTTIIHFAVSGPGAIVAVDNGNMLDHDPFQATQRKLYDGNAVAILRATSPAGHITVTATTEGLPKATLTLRLAPISQLSFERSF